ncbi:hypothetical protein OC845_003472 [Tilletia horrida]|nr:hypothetical protein OC845_003472 [Tilletia horrida]
MAPLVTGYWADWTAATLAPEGIDFHRFDIINFAFGIPTASYDISFNSDASTGLLQRLVAAALAANTQTRVVLSLGGWYSSQQFSGAVATETSRSTFAQNIFKILQQYKLDGVDLDWEYPGSLGAGNPFTGADAANFQTFLTLLRTTLGPNAIITATVSHELWNGTDQTPIKDVSQAAKALDAVLIMNYDVSVGAVGVNAPLGDFCGNSSQPHANAVAGVKQWVEGGMPKNKILLGVPAYGYVAMSSAMTMPQRRGMMEDSSLVQRQPLSPADAMRLNATADTNDLTSGDVLDASIQYSPSLKDDNPLSTYLLSRRTEQIRRQMATSGSQINFNDMIKQGILVPGPSSGPAYVAGSASGYTRNWDACSDTPYLANGQKLISYDDPQSLKDKGAFALQAGLAGVGIWSVDADTSDWALTTAVSQGLGRH